MINCNFFSGQLAEEVLSFNKRAAHVVVLEIEEIPTLFELE